MTRTHRIIALLAAVPWVIPSIVSAQQDTARTRADSLARPQGLIPVVVTAERRAETAQRVGLALSALTARELSHRGVSGIADLQRVTPSLQVEPAFGSGQPQFRLRGLGFNDYAVNNSATVGLYVDQVALPFPVQGGGLLFDLDRVEVLRGPQGTLYGRNSTGGAVNLISKRPTASREAGAVLSFGAYGAREGEGFVNGALSSTVNARLAVAHAGGGGWQHNRITNASLGDRDAYAARGQVAWQAAPDLSWRLQGSVDVDNGDATGLALFAPFATRGGQGATIPADAAHTNTGWGLRPAFARILDVDAGRAPGRRNRGGNILLEGTLALPYATLTSLSAYSTFTRREIGDWDASASAESDEAFFDDIRVVSQELRLASRDTANARAQWVAGLYLARESLDARFYSDFTDVPGLGAAALTQYGQRADAAAVFGQASWRLAPAWRVVGGVRVEYEQRQLEGLTTGFIDPAVTFVPPTDRSLLTRLPSGRLALEYRPSRFTTAWLSASRGVKSGGFTAYNTTNVAQLAAFAPERVDALEIGAKLEPTRTLRTNASAYVYDYRDQQVLSTVYDQVSRGPIGRIVNAPRSIVAGGELEVVWQPQRWLELAPQIAFTEGRYREFVTVDAQASIAQQREVTRDFSHTGLPIPRWSLGGSATVTKLVQQHLVQARVSASYRDRQVASRLIFSPTYDVAPYALVNGTVSWTRAGAPWTLELWGRNLLDRRYELTRNFFINAQVSAPGAPAMAGVRVRLATNY